MTDLKSCESRYLYDGLSFTSKCDSKEDIIYLLGLDDSLSWEVTYGAKGFKQRMYFLGISIHYDTDREDINVWCEISGQGCRAFEQYGSGDYVAIFRWIMDEPSDRHITRLDVAYDDRDTNLIDLDKIWYALERGEYVSRSSYYREDSSSGARTIYLGSRHSEYFFRIYDKAKERGYFDDDMHWVRLELQLRRDYALSFINNPASIQQKLLGVLTRNWRFIDFSGSADSNKSRLPTAEWWDNLISGIAAVSLFDKPQLDYNLSHLERYVFEQSGQAALAAISFYGLDNYLIRLNEISYKMVNNPRYRWILESSKEEML